MYLRGPAEVQIIVISNSFQYKKKKKSSWQGKTPNVSLSDL